MCVCVCVCVGVCVYVCVCMFVCVCMYTPPLCISLPLSRSVCLPFSLSLDLSHACVMEDGECHIRKYNDLECLASCKSTSIFSRIWLAGPFVGFLHVYFL